MALVWSSGVGRVCPSCGKPETSCRCPRSARGGPGPRRSPAAGPPSASAGKVVVRLEKKGRAGKAVTVIERLPLAAPELEAIAKRLKAKCGTGGTVRDGAIELQGDRVDLARGWLREQGLLG